jgi:hypothetical protein
VILAFYFGWALGAENAVVAGDRMRNGRIARDVSWKFQNCARTSELQAHHLRFRSVHGDNGMENLITLRFSCREKIHIEL